MDAVTPKTKTEPRSHHVRPANMEWQQTRFPGWSSMPALAPTSASSNSFMTGRRRW